ncbi:replication initiation factor domain-containing protein [Lactobacillus sp. Sy-1]|uniref:replication initiation factor domain-containing protein n=1 Tax=Lactobacillus sp. Sy-1 TaxID=2109645 RepID=UPI001C5A9F3C|nr:replication initiation factor domain-containing protein [Lactobacillus sp. Sy-1]MBW1606442.1 replication initiation factor domain-containing protein [Lactobacillus sp. Sy-1]
MPTQQALEKFRLESKIDWLEFTIKNMNPVEIIEELLLLDKTDFTKLERGRFGYNSQLKWDSGHVYLLFNEDETGEYMPGNNMGVHVMLTGQGCAAFNQTFNLRNLILLIIGSTEYKFTRIDLAVDDIGDRYIKFDKVAKHALKGHYVTKWSKWDEVNSRKTGGKQEFVGRTMYFGSQASDIFCRIYNKALEIAQKTKKDDAVIPENWTRLEIVYKKDRANMIVEHMVDHEEIGYIVKATLNNYLRFVEPNGDDNRSRWPMLKWWERFVRDAGKLKLTLPEEHPDIDKMQRWIDKQISPTLAAIMTAHDGDMQWLYSLIGQGKGRLKNKHLEAISRYLDNLDKEKEDG